MNHPKVNLAVWLLWRVPKQAFGFIQPRGLFLLPAAQPFVNGRARAMKQFSNTFF
jgi:hypothetical protein